MINIFLATDDHFFSNRSAPADQILENINLFYHTASIFIKTLVESSIFNFNPLKVLMNVKFFSKLSDSECQGVKVNLFKIRIGFRLNAKINKID